MRGNEIYLSRISLKDFGYIIGLYFGDGYSNYSKKDRHYRVDIYLDASSDGDIIGRLTGLLHAIGLKPYSVRCRGALRVSANSKRFKEAVETSYKELNGQLGNRDFLLGFLSGFIDADGYVTKGDIVITQRDNGIFEILSKLCERELGVKTRLWQRKAGFKSTFYPWNFRIATPFKLLAHVSCKVRRVYGGAQATAHRSENNLFLQGLSSQECSPGS